MTRSLLKTSLSRVGLAALLSAGLLHWAAPAHAAPSAKTKPSSGKAAKPCYAKPVKLLRVRGVVTEPRELSLTFCNGRPNPAAIDSVSVLARPRDVERPLLPEIRAYRARPLARGKVSPKSKKKYRDPRFVTEKVMRVDPGLLVRLQKIATHWPGRTIEIVSGYRPDSRETSRHHHGRALDMRVTGVTRERLRDFVRTFDQTGVGYYPNSYFVHMDVRDTKGYWVDRSGPGEPADYGPWPPTKQELDKTRDQVLTNALAAVSQLSKAGAVDRRTDAVATVPARASTTLRAAARVREPEQEPDDMSVDEVARVREEARRALEQL